jgi:hypothetical protein
VPVTDNVIPLEVAEVLDKQAGNVPPAVNTAFTISPLEGTKLKIALVDWDTLFLNQVYTGEVPEFTPVAVSVTPVPEQTEIADEVIFTLDNCIPATLTVKLLPVPVPKLLIGYTDIIPPIVPIVSVMPLVVAVLEVITAPDGTIHL